MLTLLLPINLLLICLMMLGLHNTPRSNKETWQGDVLLGGATFSAILVVLTEILSRVHAITQQWLALSWSGILLLLIVLAVKTDVAKRGWRRIIHMLARVNTTKLWLLICISALSFVLLVVAIASPPNNVDSLQYHMSRVMHWAQNRSIEHYPSVNTAQNIRPYFAEASILHARILWGSDLPASVIQWFAMVGSLIAATGIAANLGGNKRARWLSLVFAFSIPMGLLQATTTQNDYVSSYWVMSLAYFITLGINKPHALWQQLGLALSLGLGMLTKGTFYPFAGPLMLWYALHTLLHHHPFKRSVQEGLLIVAVATVLNAGFWFRNIATYGGPYGPSLPIGTAETAASIMPYSVPINESGSEGSVTGTLGQHQYIPPQEAEIITACFIPSSSARTFLRAHLEKALRLVTMHFVSPFHAFNQWLFSILDNYPGLFPDIFRRGMRLAIWNYEMHAGSPVHLALIFISMATLMLRSSESKNMVLPVIGAMLCGYALLTFLDYGDTIYSIRYQLPFLLLGASITGVATEQLNLRGTWILTPLLLIYALPYILISNQRPIIGMTPWPTRVGSVFTSPRAELVFAQAPDEQEGYLEMASLIHASSCHHIGIDTSGRDLEYLIWWVLGAPQDYLSIRQVNPASRPNSNSDFRPCAIVCTSCEDEASYEELSIIQDWGYLQLFMDP